MSADQRATSDAFDGAFRGRKVLVTGHTGFKGSWLTWWLLRVGADVVGYSLAPPTVPSMFETTGLAQHVESIEADVRDQATLARVMNQQQPEVVLHLAAQPIVRESYVSPVETFDVNVMGTVHVLDVVRHCPSVAACLIVTSDKCYENREWPHSYREVDALGGFDPYSASKGAAEIVTASYARSYRSDSCARIASARAGNVIGGGDWAAGRIIPDCVRALVDRLPIELRNPGSVRPWQHVLEPLSGYLQVAAGLLGEDHDRFQGPWNFGPETSSNLTVGRLVDIVLERWGSGSWVDVGDPAQQHEAQLLMLDIAKASTRLGWRPVLNVEAAIGTTVEWYQRYHSGGGPDRGSAQISELADCTVDQIAWYEDIAMNQGAPWAREVVR